MLKFQFRLRSLTACMAALVLAIWSQGALLDIRVESGAGSAIEVVKRLVAQIVEPYRVATHASVVVSIGKQGFKKALEETTSIEAPIIASFISSSDYESVMASGHGRANTTAVFSNPHPLAQYELAKTMLPAGRIAVVETTASTALIEAISATRLTVLREPRDTNALLRELNYADLLLVLPDQSIINSSNVRPVIRSLYRQRKALIGYSAKLTDIGALASVYPSQEAMMGALDQVLQHHAEHGSLPAAQFVNDIKVSVNARLAASLGFSDFDEQALERVIESALEEAP